MSREIDNWKRRMKEEVITKNYLLNGWIHRSKLGYILQYGTRRLEIENSSLSMYKNRHGNIYDSDSYTKCAGTLQLSSIKEITIKIVQMHEIEVKISSQKKIFFLYYCDFKGIFSIIYSIFINFGKLV